MAGMKFKLIVTDQINNSYTKTDTQIHTHIQ